MAAMSDELDDIDDIISRLSGKIIYKKCCKSISSPEILEILILLDFIAWAVSSSTLINTIDDDVDRGERNTLGRKENRPKSNREEGENSLKIRETRKKITEGRREKSVNYHQKDVLQVFL